MTDWLLGIDGGESKTTALLANTNAKVIGKGQGPGNSGPMMGTDAACSAIHEAVEGAMKSTKDPVQTIRAVVLGMSGIDRWDSHAVEEWIVQRFPNARTKLVNDAQLVLAAGTPKGWGLAVISGTGSKVFAQSPLGWTARADGWGHLLGDEGSGYDIGRKALVAVMRAADGRGPVTDLTDLILDFFAVAQPPDLVPEIYNLPQPRPVIAKLAAFVDQAADQGDLVATALVREAGYELALGARAVANRLGLGSPLPTALAGGVLLHGKAVKQAFIDSADELGLQLDPVKKVEEPALGAVLLARNLLEQE